MNKICLQFAMTHSKVIKRKIIDRSKVGEKKANKNVDASSQNKQLRYGPMPTFPTQRIWSKGMLVTAIIVIIWYTSRNTKVTVLASHKETIKLRGQSFPCSKSFEKEISAYPECVPKKCGRFASDHIVTATEADALQRLAKRGIALGGSFGGASILDIHTGALSHGKQFLNVYSLEAAKHVFGPADLAIYKVVKEKIQAAIAENFDIDEHSLYLTYPTFFSKLTGDMPRTVHDEYWHPHVDKDTYESFHYTSLVYLADYERDFGGGRFIFMDNANNVTVEPRKGRVLMFSSGAENMHFVEQVKHGTRYAVTVSFTCDSSRAIHDPSVP